MKRAPERLAALRAASPFLLAPEGRWRARHRPGRRRWLYRDPCRADG